MTNTAKDTNWRSWVAFLLGMTSTMPIIGIAIAGHDISFFRIIYFFTIAISIVEVLQSGRLYIKPASKKLLLWLTEGLLACIIGTITLSTNHPLWSEEARGYIPRVLIMIIFALLWASDSKWNKNCNYVIQGFLIGCIINCIWAVLDAGSFYILGKSLNNTFFSGYIARNGIRYNTLSLIYGKTIRAGGFNSDPAQIGFIAPVVAGYGIIKRKYWMVIAAAGALLASATTTGLVATIVIVFLGLSKSDKNRRLSYKKLIIGGILLVVVLALVFLYWGSITSVINSEFNSFSSRIGEVYLGNVLKGNTRISYLICLPSAMLEVIPFLLLGSGFGTASLGYALSSYAIATIGNRVVGAYDMENTYIAYFLDTGVVGIVLFISMIVFLTKKFKARMNSSFSDQNIIVYCTMIASIVSFAFYHYILFAPQMLVFTIALSILDEEEKVYVR